MAEPNPYTSTEVAESEAPETASRRLSILWWLVYLYPVIVLVCNFLCRIASTAVRIACFGTTKSICRSVYLIDSKRADQAIGLGNVIRQIDDTNQRTIGMFLANYPDP